MTHSCQPASSFGNGGEVPGGVLYRANRTDSGSTPTKVIPMSCGAWTTRPLPHRRPQRSEQAPPPRDPRPIPVQRDDPATSTGRLILTTLATLAEFEREPESRPTRGWIASQSERNACRRAHTLESLNRLLGKGDLRTYGKVEWVPMTASSWSFSWLSLPGTAV